jgi:hypothetical protein
MAWDVIRNAALLNYLDYLPDKTYFMVEQIEMTQLYIDLNV